jgi:hypothetical protein
MPPADQRSEDSFTTIWHEQGTMPGTRLPGGGVVRVVQRLARGTVRVSRAVRQVTALVVVGVVVVAVAVASCSAQTEQTPRATAQHHTHAAASRSPQGGPGKLTGRPPTDASCPITIPMDPAAIPPVLARAGGDWYGTDDLWVSLWFARPDPANFAHQDGSYRLKYGSVTLDNGRLTSRFGPPAVRATRIDGSADAKVGFGGYGYTDTLQFWPTGIDFPEPGCWLVTSSLRKTIVRFVVKVL